MTDQPHSPVFTLSTKKNSISSLKGPKPVKANRPVVLGHDIPPGTKLTFVDISHSLATIDIESKHNKFSALIDTANDWLQKNYIWKVENCETVGLAFKDEKLDPVDFGATQRLLQPSSHVEQEEMVVLKGLRLWISRRDDVPEMKRRVDLQIIAYKTFLPMGCKFYEKQIGWQQLDDIIETVNDALKSKQIIGQLLNVESIQYEATEDWVVDTECPRNLLTNNKNEIALRVFYVANAVGDTPTVEIGIFDLLPDVSDASTTPPKFEPFSSLLYKMQDFLEENPEYTLLNCQSMDIKFRSVDQLHTHFMVQINDIGVYLRYLRMIVTKPASLKMKERPNRSLSVNAVPPNQIKSAGNSPKSGVTTERADSESGDLTKVAKEVKVVKAKPMINLESHFFEIHHDHNTLHGPYYPVKRAIEEFMERPEWQPWDYRRPDRRWKYLCAETVTVLAKDENELAMRAECSLSSNRHSLLFILVPKVYNVVRIFFDTGDVIPVRAPHKSLKKCQSESFDKHFKTGSFRQQSLPDSTVQYLDNTKETVHSLRNKIKNSVACCVM